MKFGAVPVASATGAILAHSMAARAQGADTTYRVAKGTILTAEHLRDLAQAGHDTVVVARLDNTDVEENDAATRLAKAIAPDAATLGLRISVAGAGRVNLYALHAGVCVIDDDAVHALNAVDPMITIATVAPFHRTDAGSMIATIKIIAYGVSETALSRAQTAAPNAIRIAAPAYNTASLIETNVAQDDPSLKGRDALFGRLHRMGMTLTDRCVVAHKERPLAHAIQEATGEVIFVLTASATSDPMDVGPQALRQAGGTVTGFGMPVDPGNLLFFGVLKDKPVIGLPGCARSPALNGADWVLERLICGLPLTQADISRMGVGGLLKEIPTRPQPRSTSVT